MPGKLNGNNKNNSLMSILMAESVANDEMYQFE
jgi:hypothetical protein